jgi:hypothetical protein
MPIQSISPVKQNSTFDKNRLKHDLVKVTGYSALGLGAGSVALAQGKKFKSHKILAYLAGIFTLAHVGILEYNHSQYKKAQK